MNQRKNQIPDGGSVHRGIPTLLCSQVASGLLGLIAHAYV